MLNDSNAVDFFQYPFKTTIPSFTFYWPTKTVSTVDYIHGNVRVPEHTMTLSGLFGQFLQLRLCTAKN